MSQCINEKMNQSLHQIISFPNPKTHEFVEWISVGDYIYNGRDILGFGGDLSLENLVNAYQHGIFPWTIEGLPLPWFCPENRAILEFDDLHIPKSLRKEFAKTTFTFTIDKCFREVITRCSQTPRTHESGTWITQDFIDAYCDLHKFGMAHSVEVWDESELVGGLYGVDSCGVFCGESMFHERSNASKFAFLHLIEHLENRGATWLDIQVMTPHFEILGAIEIPRNDFLNKLEATLAKGIKLFD
jgi:leucyl/phenylalanyl-tRNA---protein transferase